MNDELKRQAEELAEAYMIDNVVEGGAAEEMHNCMKDFVAGFEACHERMSAAPPNNRSTKILTSIDDLKAQLAERDQEIELLKVDLDWCVSSPMFEEHKRLKERLRVYEEALEFYAERDSWFPSDAFAENTVIHVEDQYCHKGDHFFGGKKARKALSRGRGEK